MAPPEKVAVWCWSRTSRTRSVAETMLTERVTRLRSTVEGSELNFCSKAFLKSAALTSGGPSLHAPPVNSAGSGRCTRGNERRLHIHAYDSSPKSGSTSPTSTSYSPPASSIDGSNSSTATCSRSPRKVMNTSTSIS